MYVLFLSSNIFNICTKSRLLEENRLATPFWSLKTCFGTSNCGPKVSERYQNDSRSRGVTRSKAARIKNIIFKLLETGIFASLSLSEFTNDQKFNGRLKGKILNSNLSRYNFNYGILELDIAISLVFGFSFLVILCQCECSWPSNKK